MPRTVFLALIAFPLLAVPASEAAAQAKRQGGGSSGGMPTPSTGLQANDVLCGMNNAGNLCYEAFTTPYPGSGWWPRTTTNPHIYGVGLQVHGIIPRAGTCTDEAKLVSNRADCFRWAGDTVAAWFHEGAGTRSHGSSITNIYDSRQVSDLAAWPSAGSIPRFAALTAFITDTSIYASSLIGRKSISEQDTWVAYWDGDPVRTGGRLHPAGVLVEQRTHAWNYPSGNESTIYYVLKVTNVTHDTLFQRLNETRYFGGQDSLPNAGWKLDSVFVSLDADPDITNDPSSNYLTGIMPFDMMAAYKGDFRHPDFPLPQSHFHPPFFGNATSLVGLYFLRTPRSAPPGLRAFGQYTGGGAFPPATSTPRGWRYMALKTDPVQGDPACMLPPAEMQARRTCAVLNVVNDAKGFLSTGPFTLEPGASETVILALTVAATVATPEIVPGSDNKPGLPSLAPGCADPVRPIERAAGWVSTRSCGAVVSPADVEVVPGSLLGKAAVARALLERKFLMSTPPVAPPFALIPGRDRVTVIWEPSATESDGDPFADAAEDPTSPLHDLNFRAHDVEGYRIWRGTTPDDLKLVAQFDRKGTEFVDQLCVTDPTHIVGTPCNGPITRPIDGASLSGVYGRGLIQYRVITSDANGAARIESADTALSRRIREGTSDFLTGTGIPYAWVDTDVRDGFRYYYRVTAFDINSIRSTSSSLESESETKSAMPRPFATGFRDAEFTTGLFGRTKPLDPGTAPTLDPATGMFDGPQQATSQLSAEFTAYATQLLATGTREIRIDSIVPAQYSSGTIATYHLTIDGEHASIPITNSTVGPTGSGLRRQDSFDLPVRQVPADPAIRADLQAKGLDAPAHAAVFTGAIVIDQPLWNSLFADWAYKQPGFWAFDPPNTSWAGGSRWFTGANESMPDPTLDVTSHGRLEGVSRIFQPTPYRLLQNPQNEPRAVGPALASYMGRNGDVFRRFYGSVLGLTRAADVKLYWGNARLDSIIDVTHNVPVPFSTAVRASYGFLTDADNDGVLTYADFYYRAGLETSPANEIDVFARQAKPFAQQPAIMPVNVTGGLQQDGVGFGLYINGEPYIFALAAVPANTVWTLRTYNGTVARASDGTYSFTSTGSNPAVPGLRFAAVVTAPAQYVPTDVDLARVHTVPDPYYASGSFDVDSEHRELRFVNVPPRATIRIYTLSGVLVDVINHDDASNGGLARWDLRGRGNHYVNSGVYLFHISTPDGKQHVGRFTVVMGKTW